MATITAQERNFYLRIVGYIIAAIAIVALFVDIENIIKLASHLLKFIVLIVFLAAVILFNLNKGYQTHKAEGKPFNLNDFLVYSKNRISEFFSVSRNVYISFSVIAVLFTAVTVSLFLVKTEEKVEDGKMEIVKARESFDEFKKTQTEQLEELIKTTEKAAEDAAVRGAQKAKEEICADVNNVARSLTGICNDAPRGNTRNNATAQAPVQSAAPQPEAPPMPAVTVTATPAVQEPLTIAPSTPLSDDDVIIKKRNEALYTKDARPFTIKPTSQ